MARYQWESPQDWLQEQIRCLELPALRSIALDLLSLCDADQIQDMFQNEMDTDGYFEDLDKPTDEEEE